MGKDTKTNRLIDKEHGDREKESAEDNVGPAAEQNTVHFGFVFFTKMYLFQKCTLDNDDGRNSNKKF